MPKSKASSKGLSSSHAVEEPATASGVDLKRQYGLAISILDASISSAIIAGIQPYAFQAVCSFWFLQTMGMSRMTDLSIDNLLNPPSVDIFEKVIAAVQIFIDRKAKNYRADEGGEEEDFDVLVPHRLTISKYDPVGGSDEEKAVKISHYCMGQFEDNGIEPRALELAYLVMYYKVAALSGSHSKEEYLTVRRSVPEILHAYDEIAWQGRNDGMSKAQGLEKQKQVEKTITDGTAIVDILQRYLKESATASKSANAKREATIALFEMYLNDYGRNQLLDEDEESMFGILNDADGDDHRDFCQVFGADKFLIAVEMFVDDHLISSVAAGATTLSAHATEMAKFCLWLKKCDLVDADRATETSEIAKAAAKALPRRLKASDLLDKNVQSNGFDLPEPEVEGGMTITKLNDKAIWLKDDLGEEFGPIALPKETLETLDIGWNFYCCLSKKGGKWLLAEVGPVYNA